jgi:hypothetical protein
MNDSHSGTVFTCQATVCVWGTGVLFFMLGMILGLEFVRLGR